MLLTALFLAAVDFLMQIFVDVIVEAESIFIGIKLTGYIFRIEVFIAALERTWQKFSLFSIISIAIIIIVKSICL